MHTSTTRECCFSHTKRCGSWHAWDKLCGFIHFDVEYVIFYEVQLFVWEKQHSLVGLLPLPKHQKPTVVATDLHSSTIITEEQRKVHLMDILNFNTTQSKLSTKLLGTSSITKLQNQHIAIPYTVLKYQELQQLLFIRLVTMISSCQIETTEIPISNILFWFTYNGHLILSFCYGTKFALYSIDFAGFKIWWMGRNSECEIFHPPCYPHVENVNTLCCIYESFANWWWFQIPMLSW